MALRSIGYSFEVAVADVVDNSIDARSGKRTADEIDAELSRLAEAVATQGASSALLKAISMRETERKAIEEALWSSGQGAIQTALSELRAFAMNQLEDIRSLLRGEVRAARFELSKHLDRMIES